jgi:hypothetical protein
MTKGKFLKRGHAHTQYTQFMNDYGTKNFPQGVCYSLAELQTFIDTSNEMFDRMQFPPAAKNRGVALTLGVHIKEEANDPPSYADGKITIMMVAAIWADDTTITGHAAACDNHVLNPRPPAPLLDAEPLNGDEFKDVSYDAGSLFP